MPQPVPKSEQAHGRGAALRHLELLFRPFLDKNKGYFHVGHLGKSKIWYADAFPTTTDGFNRAISYAEKHAALDNIYVRPGLVRPDYRGDPARATDDEIIALNAVWIDCDEPEHFAKIDGDDSLPEPTFHVITGERPHIRRQSWWILEDPAQNVEAWEALSKDLSAAYGSDSAVTNPSRWMRLAGFTAQPFKPGRVVEPVYAVKGSWAAVRFDELYSRFAGAHSASVRGANIHSEPGTFDRGGFYIDTGDGHSDDELVAMLDAAKADGQWHIGVRDVVAALVGRRYTDATIHAWVATYGRADGGAGDGDVQKLIDGARKKYGVPNRGDGLPFDDDEWESDMDADVGPVVKHVSDFVNEYVPPEYTIDGVIRRSFCYALTAPTGTGKTAIALDMAFAVAGGRRFAGLEVEQGAVVFLAGENPEDVKARVILIAERQGVDLTRLPLYFVETRYDIAADMQLLAAQVDEIGGAQLVIVDTSAAYFPGGDENANAEMIAWARTLRRLCAELPGKPAAVIPAHPRNNWSAEHLVPRGGGGFLAEIDGNLALWPAGDAVKLHHSGKHRGPDFEPVMFEIVEAAAEGLRDKKGRPIPSAFARAVTDRREEELAASALSDEDALLYDMRNKRGLSFAKRCVSLGWVSDGGKPQKSKLERVLARLQRDGLVWQARGRWVLTKSGEEEAKRIAERNGDIDLESENDY